jgi:predicted nucleic acid-binding protein
MAIDVALIPYILIQESTTIAINCRRWVRKKGIIVSFTDIFIAASAVSNNAILVHANHHFELFRNQIDLQTENLLPIL